MILGFDIGTTNTLSVVYDNNIFRIVPHILELNSTKIIKKIFPSVISISKNKLIFGLEAENLPNTEKYMILSVKSKLKNYKEGSKIKIGKYRFDLADIYFSFIKAVTSSTRKSLNFKDKVNLAVFTIPANSSSIERWLLRQAAIKSNIAKKIILLDEPIASVLEYFQYIKKDKEDLIVYDLGGGTFDVSHVKKIYETFNVIKSEGINNLGGDNFDELLIEMICEKLKFNISELTLFEKNLIVREVRRAKESLVHYNDCLPDKLNIMTGFIETKHLKKNIDISTELFITKCNKLINKTINILNTVYTGELKKKKVPIYITGGGSIFPPVRNSLLKNFSNIIFSQTPLETVSIGSVIYGKMDKEKVISSLARHIGIVRLTNNHKEEFFDIIFHKTTKLPIGNNKLTVIKGPYIPYHNIGRLQFIEAGALNEIDNCERDIKKFKEILFPFDKAINKRKILKNDMIKYTGKLKDIKIIEEYILDSNGIISLKIKRLPDNLIQNFEILS